MMDLSRQILCVNVICQLLYETDRQGQSTDYRLSFASQTSFYLSFHKISKPYYQFN